MLRGSSPGLRAAIGFLQVFEFFAGLWYLAGIVVVGVRCVVPALVSGPVGTGLREVAVTWLVVFALGLVFAIRSGARAMAEDLGLRHLASTRRSDRLLREWGWGGLRFLVGISAGVFTVQGAVATWLLLISTANDARVVIVLMSWAFAAAGWAGLPWIWRLGKPRTRTAPPRTPT